MYRQDIDGHTMNVHWNSNDSNVPMHILFYTLSSP